ncbi:ComEC/Rec2 family competence protein [Caldinitratiruptor microaerophilus]|uniref:Metallo-beta-lactamase domain-containing protein n=1 Tax=Caldinitratiruptor microaerophilus TaxID=671077 RepID=A0AA35CJH9_9FIRM|nr:MBL fold metallo-hydrolase [Caldinitratiruptor microaerophilus]BDG60362.1 hypothetical protein caldi_14520 [Caldinitratiruptor microaerophilus]
MAHVEVEFLDVGQGDSTLIKLPNGKMVLIDCHFNGPSESVLDHVLERLPKDENCTPYLDCLVITHPHEDHIGGIGKLGQKAKIKSIWESGHRLYIPRDKQDEYTDYYDMLDLIRRIKRQGGTVKVLRANRRGFTGGLDDRVQWYCLSPSRAYAEQERPSEDQIHEQCLVLKLEFGGNSIMFTGDSSWRAWSEAIVPSYSELIPTTFLHVSHHGSISFFADSEDSESYIDHLRMMEPDISIVSVGLNNYGHPHAKAMELYRKWTHHYARSKGQVMRTDELGHIVTWLYEDGTYEIMPRYHMEALSGRFILARAKVRPEPGPDADGTYRRGVDITFNLEVSRVPDFLRPLKVRWEVQNNGVGRDHRIHDWYLGKLGFDTVYQNRTAFHGRHNLYVKVTGKNGAPVAEFVHIVRVRDEG